MSEYSPFDKFDKIKLPTEKDDAELRLKNHLSEVKHWEDNITENKQKILTATKEEREHILGCIETAKQQIEFRQWDITVDSRLARGLPAEGTTGAEKREYRNRAQKTNLSPEEVKESRKFAEKITVK